MKQHPEDDSRSHRDLEAERWAHFFGWRIVTLCVLLMLGFLVTSSVFLTIFIVMAAALYLLQGYEPFDHALAEQPALKLTAQLAPVVILGIFGFALFLAITR